MTRTITVFIEGNAAVLDADVAKSLHLRHMQFVSKETGRLAVMLNASLGVIRCRNAREKEATQ